MRLMKFYENDDVKVKEDKINHLFFSNPQFLKVDEEDNKILSKPEVYLRKNIGKVIECDFCKNKKEWTHFVHFKDKKSGEEIRLWFLESELVLI